MSPSHHLKTETDPATELLYSFVFLEYRTMDEVLKPIDCVLYSIVRTLIMILDIIHHPNFYLNKTFRRLDSASVFRSYLFS
jgi:hypothetical protein